MSKRHFSRIFISNLNKIYSIIRMIKFDIWTIAQVPSSTNPTVGEYDA